MSMGSAASQVLNDAVQSAVSAGITVVVAAGNNNVDACTFSPASAPDAITVAAIDDEDNRASFSNFGRCVALFAPGCNIVSSWNLNSESYEVLSGTSMASPHVAGVAAYLMSRQDLRTPQAVKAQIISLATSNMIPFTNGTANLIAFNGYL
ncbi:serine protease [Xylariaceae sp. FL0255]|nr:serine protease [Xylariaceae sp. FL0255]